MFNVENQAAPGGHLVFFSPTRLQRKFSFGEKGDWEF